MMNIDTKNDENNDSNNLNNSVNDEDNDFSNNNSLNNVIGEKDNLYCAPCNKKVKKRDNVIKWDEYFMAVAFLSSMRYNYHFLRLLYLHYYLIFISSNKIKRSQYTSRCMCCKY